MARPEGSIVCPQDLGIGKLFENVAEGVETVGQLACLREMGCDFAQGYYFAKPLPSEAAAHCSRSTLAGKWITLTYFQPQRVSNLRFSVTPGEYV